MNVQDYFIRELDLLSKNQIKNFLFNKEKNIFSNGTMTNNINHYNFIKDLLPYGFMIIKYFYYLYDKYLIYNQGKDKDIISTHICLIRY